MAGIDLKALGADELKELGEAVSAEKKRRDQAAHEEYMAGCEGRVVPLCVPRVIEPTAPCPRCGRDGIHKATAKGSRFWCRYCQGWYDQDGHPLHPNDV